MKKSIICFLLTLGLPVLGVAAVHHANINGDNARAQPRHDFVVFAKSNAHKLDGVTPDGKCNDLSFLKKFAGDAKIFALGESRHSGHEFLQVRRRIVACLVKQEGFTNILIEAGLPYAARLNAYIHNGKGNPEQLVAGMAYWSLYENQETLGMLQWLKDYNASADHHHKVSLLGIDMQDPGPGINAVMDYLRHVDPQFYKQVNTAKGDFGIFDHSPNVVTLTRAYKQMPDQAYKALSEKLALIDKHLKAEHSRYIDHSGKQAYDWVMEEFATVMQAHHMYSVVRTGSFNDLFQAREQALVENVEWQIKFGGDGGRYVLLSHNTHIAKATVFTAGPHRKTYEDKPLGMTLAKAWPGRYVALAGSFYEGKGMWHNWQNDADWSLGVARPQSLDAVLADTGLDLFVVSFRDLAPESPAYTWANTRQLMRSEGAITALVPLSAYDGVLFIRRLSQAHLTRQAIARLEAMGPPRPAQVHVDKTLLHKTQGSFLLSSRTSVEFKAEKDKLYALWNQWKFRAFPLSKDEFELRLTPPVFFKFERKPDGSIESMQVRRGNGHWQHTRMEN